MSIYDRPRKKDGIKIWYYDFTYKGERYYGQGGTTRTQALRVQEKIRTQVINDEYGLNTTNNPKIDIFVDKFLNRRSHLKSITRDRQLTNNLLKHLSGKRLNQITADDLEEFMSKRDDDDVSNSTINRELSCLRRMYNLAKKWNDCRNNPVADIDFRKEPAGRTRFLSTTEISNLLEKCPPHIASVVVTAVYTGMRLSEILNLKWSNVFVNDVINPFIEIPNTKNNKKRHIPLNIVMIEMMTNLKNRESESEFVFLNSRGKRHKSIRNQFNLALDNANITDFRFHDLRHTFASHFVMKSGDLLSLKEILGHSSLKMVERYAHLASSHKQNMINNLDFPVKNHRRYPKTANHQ
jgi:site-specific recombinase XerD